MRIFLIAICLTTIVLTACDITSAPVSESGGSTSPTQVEESGPALLLSEDSAISILQSYLQECVLSWDVEYVSSPPGQEMKRAAPIPSVPQKKWWMDLATGSAGSIAWSAQFHDKTTGGESWVVIGVGLARSETGLVAVPGRWQVQSGERPADPLDAPARIALREFKKPLDPKFDSHCTGILRSGGSATIKYFTRGASQDDVLRLQGTPDEVRTYGLLNEETWWYASSFVEFSLPDRRVTDWSNGNRNLKVFN